MRSITELPEAENSEAKEVFAFFGLASYHAQVCEKGLVNMAVILQARGSKLTTDLWDGLFGQFDPRTFGQLLHEIKKKLTINEEDEALLREALKKRNWIAHQFFADFSIDFTLESGRRKMIEELKAVTTLFMRADICTSRLYESDQKSLGLTGEILEKLITQQQTEYRNKSGA